MEYLTIPMQGGVNYLRGHNTPMGAPTSMRNFLVQAEGGYRRVSGSSAHPAGVLGGLLPSIRGLVWFKDEIWVFNVVSGGTTDISSAAINGVSWVSQGSIPYSAQDMEFAIGDVDGTEKLYVVLNGQTDMYWFDGTTSGTHQILGVTAAFPEPSRIAIFKNRVWLACDNIVVFSMLGDPTNWEVHRGAGQIKFHSNITAMKPLVGNTLGIWTETSFHTITGTNINDFTVDNVNDYGNEVGAYAGTVQQMGNRTLFASSRGIVELSAALEFGNFKDSLIAPWAQPYYNHFRDTWGKPEFSFLSKKHSQFFAGFNGGNCFTATFDGANVSGVAKFYPGTVVQCALQLEDSSGEEYIYVGTSDGYVLRMFDPTAKRYDLGSSTDDVVSDISLIIDPTATRFSRIEVHEIAMDLVIHDTSATPVDPVITVSLFGKTITLNIEDQEATFPGTISSYWGRKVLARAKLHATGTWDEIAIDCDGNYEPFTVKSVTIGYTQAGQHYAQELT